MTQIELIKAEINRRLGKIGAFGEVGDSDWEYVQGLVDIYKDILSFIDSLEKQEPQGLDEAELMYVESSNIPPANQEEDMMVYQAFKAGAKWMAEQTPKLPYNLDEVAELEPAIDEYLRVVKEASLRQIARYFAQWGAKWQAEQTSNLPDNLDEAAEEYAKECLDLKFPTTDEKCVKADVLHTFKAGAKWMAEQGVSWEDELGWYDGLLLYSHDERQNLAGTDFNIGDKVIVQIRKK